MADKSRPSQKTIDEKALDLAQRTEVSPQQAKELMAKHGEDSPKVEEEARAFRAES